MDRRQFVNSVIGGVGVSLVPSWMYAGSGKTDQPLKILVLGGTGFLGPHTVEYALKRGHEVTLFNRGKTNNELFPDLETIIGDRDPDKDAGLSGLEGRKWDAVIDNSGYVPRMVGASATTLAGNVGQYLFVSTICQYDGWMEGDHYRTEDVPRATLEDPLTEDVRTHYCELKAYCERSVDEAAPGIVTHIRPGLIVGPLDKTDRYTYWPVRMARGGEVLAPGKPSDLTQYIDVRDLGQFMVHCVENKTAGAFNAVGMPMPWGDFLENCRKAVNPDTKLTWVPAGFLAENDVQPWRDIMMWADSETPLSGSLSWSSQKAVDAGMIIRPGTETARDTLAWFQSLPEERQAEMHSGMKAEREAELLTAWHTHQTNQMGEDE